MEAGIEGAEAWDTVVDAVINMKLREYSGKRDYPEMHVETDIAFPSNGSSYLDLPLNFRKIRYARFGDEDYNLSSYYNTDTRLLGNTPRYFKISGKQLLISPYESIIIGDILHLGYIKYPDKLINPTDEFPIPELETTVLHAAAKSLSRVGNPEMFAMNQAEERESFVASRH